MKETWLKFKIKKGIESFHVNAPSLDRAFVILKWKPDDCEVEELGPVEVEVEK